MAFEGFLLFFRKKTVYEMRISDWSSDVCSSDLRCRLVGVCEGRVSHDDGIGEAAAAFDLLRLPAGDDVQADREAAGRKALLRSHLRQPGTAAQIGRASCRERVCQYV